MADTDTSGPDAPEIGTSLIEYLADNDGACFGCGYNLRGLDVPRCPECRMSFESVDADRFRWINGQIRFESRLLLFALIILPIEIAIIAPIAIMMGMGLLALIMFESNAQNTFWYVIFTSILLLVLGTWVTSWMVFLRAKCKPLGRFAALGDGPMKTTRIGRAAMIIDLLAVLVGLAMISVFAWGVF